MGEFQVSICIPTYNRCDYLKNTLASIVEDEAFLQKKIEIVISDNASTDSTELVCNDFLEKYSNIAYFRHEETIDAGLNYTSVIKKASGNLRKLWNDTMIMEKGAGQMLCDIEKRYRGEIPILFFKNASRKFFESLDSGIISFDKLMQKASYGITWNGSFSVWASQVDKFDNQGDLSLWAAKQFCKLAENGGVFIRFSFAGGPTVKGRDISYGLYKVFYQNLMEDILLEYKRNGNLTSQTYEFIRKDLLFNYFASAIAGYEAWKNGDKSSIYSATEDLPKLVHEQYSQEPYYDRFLLYYESRKAKQQGDRFKYLVCKLKYIVGSN